MLPSSEYCMSTKAVKFAGTCDYYSLIHFSTYSYMEDVWRNERYLNHKTEPNKCV